MRVPFKPLALSHSLLLHMQLPGLGCLPLAFPTWQTLPFIPQGPAQAFRPLSTSRPPPVPTELVTPCSLPALWLMAPPLQRTLIFYLLRICAVQCLTDV